MAGESSAFARTLQALARRYEVFTVSIGLFGNTLFLMGSVLFFLNVNTPAAVLFMLGSLGMLIGSIGRALVDYERHRERRARAGGPVRGTDSVPSRP